MLKKRKNIKKNAKKWVVLHIFNNYEHIIYVAKILNIWSEFSHFLIIFIKTNLTTCIFFNFVVYYMCSICSYYQINLKAIKVIDLLLK